MCFICLNATTEYMCPRCKSTDSTVCTQCHRESIRCPFCKCRLHQQWLINISFDTIIKIYKSLPMYKLHKSSIYNIYDLNILELQILIGNVDKYIRHNFDKLFQKSQHIVKIVRKKISLQISELSVPFKYPVPILRNPYQTLPSE